MSRGSTVTLQCYQNILLGPNEQGTSPAVSLNGLAITLPTGWTGTVAIDGGAASAITSGAVKTVSPAINVLRTSAPINAVSFTVALQVPCTAATGTSNITVKTTHTAGRINNQTLTAGSGPTTTVGTTVAGVSAPTVALGNANLGTTPYATTARSVSGSMTLGVTNPSGCGAWRVTISGTALSYSGPYGGSAIPVSNVRIVSATGTGVVALPLALSGSPQNLITSGPTGTSFSYVLGLQVTIQGGALVGTYHGVVTVTSAAAP